jgi:hypothetical protein
LRELSGGEARDLARQLDATRVLYPDVVPYKDKHVWHCSFAIPEQDGELSNMVWGEIVEKVLTDVGFVEEGLGGVFWAVFRHGKSRGVLNEETNQFEGRNDHVHLAVNLIREDGTRINTWQDLVKLSKAAGRVEEQYGLTKADGRTAGTLKDPTRAEFEKADREGKPEN